MRKVSRSLLVALALVGAVVMSLGGAVATSADTGLRHSGAYGVHFLADSAEFPGVRCFYNNSNVIRAIRVRDPLVFARNKVTGRLDSQWVSWYFRVQAQTPGASGWTTVATSAVQKRIATDRQVADFSQITKRFAGTAAKQYRVVVVMRWYNPRGRTVVGRATHRADWYSWVGVPSFNGVCPGGIF
jgi:hypothetical protein